MNTAKKAAVTRPLRKKDEVITPMGAGVIFRIDAEIEFRQPPRVWYIVELETGRHFPFRPSEVRRRET